jgi:sensor histidine kinase YesM
VLGKFEFLTRSASRRKVAESKIALPEHETLRSELHAFQKEVAPHLLYRP